MKSLGARFARCVNRVFRRTGRVLATRFHHVVKRTPTEVRRALAYVLLNIRKHYRERRRRKPPAVLGGASSGLWFDGWKGRSPPAFGWYADRDRACEVAAPRTWLLEKGWRKVGFDRSGGGARGPEAAPTGLNRLATSVLPHTDVANWHHRVSKHP